jgi:superfamily II DNA/RNA helicase
MQFSDLGLDPDLLRAIDESGYSEPTPIQAAAIPHALAGRDVLGIAQTGTGKTAGFTLPMIHLLSKGRARARMPRSLILCPTRELAAQVSENFEKYGKYKKLTMALLIGGVNFNQQDKLIDRGVDVLIATPGRLLDHFERGKLMLTGIQIMVVDEADRMLDMGFIPDIERIFKLTPFTRQTLFFSATMAPEIQRITDTFLQNPERVEVARQASAAETVTQKVVTLQPSSRERADREKRDCLRALIRAESGTLTNAIVFCNRKRDVGVLQKSLVKHGLNAGAIHGDLEQSVRMATLNGFRDGQIDILVASDVAARGLDIPNVSHVFNFDVPTHPEDYVHRIGRTGRAGRSGTAITICLPSDRKYLDRIEEMLGSEIPREEGEAPQAEETPERGGRRRRSEKPEPAEAKEAEKAPAAGRGKGEAKGGRGKGEPKGGRGKGGRAQPDKPVVGLGDHVPAFLLREVRPASRKKGARAEGEDDETDGSGGKESEAA